MIGRRTRTWVLALLLGACTSAPPTPTSAPPDATVSALPAGSPGIPISSTAPPSPTPVVPAPATGRPYTPEQVLAAMRDSRRPGGVPDQIETMAVATQLASRIWTYHGRAYPSLVVGGSCGPATCTVEVNGAPAGAAGTDLYTFSVTRATGAVALLASDLRGYPSALDPIIDDVVRAGLDPARLDGLALTGAAWQLPPRAGWFWVAYRSGGEEGSPGLDVLVALPAGEVVETREP